MYSYFYSLFYNTQPNHTQTSRKKITDADIKNISVSEIEQMRIDQSNQFELTNNALNDAFDCNNTEKMKYLHDTFNLVLNGNGNFHIDKSLETGNKYMTILLITTFNCNPSLYAQQMAHINGHHALAVFSEEFSEKRNNVGIMSVHRRFNRDTKKFEWDDCIPVEYRFDE